MKSHIKTAKMKLPLHEFPFIKATAPFSLGNFTVWLHLKSVLLFQKTKLEKFLFDEAVKDRETYQDILYRNAAEKYRESGSTKSG